MINVDLLQLLADVQAPSRDATLAPNPAIFSPQPCLTSRQLSPARPPGRTVHCPALESLPSIRGSTPSISETRREIIDVWQAGI